MKVLVLLAFIPSLIVADILCPNSKTTCPEGKQCCEVNGEYSCCDPDDNQDVTDIKTKVFPGDDIMSSSVFENTMFSVNESKLAYCDFFSCSGTCCGSGCCPYKMAACCSGDKCCPSLGTCCNGGCCGALQKCCGSGCCDFQAACCESWCCKKGYRCGKSYLSCRSAGITISPNIVALLLVTASAFVSRRF